MSKLKHKILPTSQGGLWLLLAGFALALTGCGTENDLGTNVSGISKVTDIPQESADNYDDNVNGLITGNTLKSWITDWTNNRPDGITGKLVILQSSTGEAGYEFIKPDGTNVFTYGVAGTEWKETRSNGVTETVSMVPSGRAVDTFLAKYGIDPANDMIVCAQGTASTGNAMGAGRCWYMFRYWGTPSDHLAQLNGGNQWLGTGTNTALEQTDFAATASTPPMNGTASVKDLPEANMALQATLEDMHAIVPAQDVNLLADGVFIWDARGNTLPASDPLGQADEYSPDDDSDHRNGGATQGHPNGALLLAFSNLLNNCGTECTFKSKAEIQAYLDGNVDTGGNGFVGADLVGVGQGNAYQPGDVIYTYCETTYRAMITGFATAAIMGLPTRFYDGAMTEWHSMAYSVYSVTDPNTGAITGTSTDTLVPWDSPWRTDKNELSMFRYYAAPTTPTPRNLNGVVPRNIVNAYAASANAIINEDLAYKGYTTDSASASSTSTDGASSGGSVLPPNPCGG